MHSPFSSLLLDPSSPAAARRERATPRHASADFTETEIEDDTEDEREDQQDGGEGEDGEIDEVDEDGLEEEDGDEDPPLLPIFSAAHLGIYLILMLYLQVLISTRLPPSLQPHACHTTYCPTSNGNDINMGSIALSTSVAVSGQTHATTNSNIAFL
jgi:hypothetical protein